ncbi:MAG: glucose sorbosone dehydrogenase [Thaumarchaeota archaeon]|nr:glucose sorbosone dehydrogenase [Nitrososphaerota archaeon]|tara:strand:+ start:3933 stop:5174 length:1242 start_codon:yes stop_codon:yes gene_type:complete
MNSKKTIIIIGIFIFSIFLFMNSIIPVDYLTCLIIPATCNFFNVIDNEDHVIDNSVEINDMNIELEIAFSEIQVGNMIYLTTANDGSGRIFIGTREGIIFYIEENSNDIELFIDIRNKIDQGLPGERGLLGFTFDPDYINNGYFYIHYNDFDGTTIISRFKNINDIESRFNSELKILKIEQPYSNHNGGSIDFGPDGYLYIALGDGGSGGDPLLHGQNGNTLLGSILRIDVSKSSENNLYQIPNDNPFIDNDKFRDEIWAYGLRNPWRMSFDKETGKLFVGDVGQNKFEEINIIEKGGNYGWNIMEGNSCFNNENCNKNNLIMPIVEYSHNEGCSVTGGYVYHGEIDSLKNNYIFTDFCSGDIWIIDLEDKHHTRKKLLQGPFQIPSLGQDENGEVYILSFDGRIYKFTEKRQ